MLRNQRDLGLEQRHHQPSNETLSVCLAALEASRDVTRQIAGMDIEGIAAPWIVVDIEATFCAVMTILLCQACGVHSASTVIDDEQHLDRLLSKLRQSNNKHARMMGDICLLFRGSPIVDRAAVTVPSSGEVVAPKGTKPIPTVGDPLVGLSVPCSGSTGHMSLSRGLRAGHQINEQDFNYGLDDSELAQVHRELEGPNNEWEQILLEIVGEPFSLRAT